MSTDVTSKIIKEMDKELYYGVINQATLENGSNEFSMVKL